MRLLHTMDVDELVKEYAAVEAVAEDILSDKQQVRNIFIREYCISCELFCVSPCRLLT